jgi:uncharacterized repeat protein (TIGR02543 family)
VDTAKYASGSTVTVLGNTGILVKTGSVFSGWNSSAAGTGSGHASGSTFTMGSANVSLYATWTLSGTGETLLELTPRESRLYSRPADSGRILVSMGLGPALPINEWSTWRIDNSSYIWLSFPALADKTYTVYWNDMYNGSLASDSAPFYNADIEVGAFLADGVTRVSGWASDVDNGYTVGVLVTVGVSQNVKLRIRTWNGGAATGGFGIKILSSDEAASGTAYTWYVDGTLQASVTGFNGVMLTPSSFASGTHRLIGIATRGDITFSEEYSFIQ